MRRASAAALIFCAAGCASASVAGFGPKAALGWTLGGEVHLFLADSETTRRVYGRIVRAHLTAAPASFDSAVARRAVVTLAAESLGVPAAANVATILSASGAAPAELRLIRLHGSGDCLVPGPVTELVYAFTAPALATAPRSHAPVVGLLAHAPRPPPAEAPPPGGRPSGRALTGEDARRYIRRAALAAERRTARRDATPGWPLAARLAVDPDAAADAGEVLPVDGTGDDGAVAVGFRVRFLEADGDTVLVSGVAVTSQIDPRLRWILEPARAPLHGGLLARDPADPASGRYALRGVVFDPARRPLLLVDRVADVAPLGSRSLAVAVDGGTVVATQPLALRCR